MRELIDSHQILFHPYKGLNENAPPTETGDGFVSAQNGLVPFPYGTLTRKEGMGFLTKMSDEIWGTYTLYNPIRNRYVFQNVGDGGQLLIEVDRPYYPPPNWDDNFIGFPFDDEPSPVTNPKFVGVSMGSGGNIPEEGGGSVSFGPTYRWVTEKRNFVLWDYRVPESEQVGYYETDGEIEELVGVWPRPYPEPPAPTAYYTAPMGPPTQTSGQLYYSALISNQTNTLWQNGGIAGLRRITGRGYTGLNRFQIDVSSILNTYEDIDSWVLNVTVSKSGATYSTNRAFGVNKETGLSDMLELGGVFGNVWHTFYPGYYKTSAIQMTCNSFSAITKRRVRV